jgi:hypothetical protein
MAQAAAAGTGVGGSLLSAFGNIQQGNQQYAAAKYQAAQLESNAKQAEAAGQRDMQDQLRQSALLQSRALAVAGASGAGATDPTVLKIISGIAGEGQLAAETALFNANEQARGMRNQGAATMFEGKQVRAASRIKALSTVLSGAGNAAMAGSKFNNGGWFGMGNAGGFGGVTPIGE